MKTRLFILLFCFLLLSANTIFGQIDRPFEPIIIKGEALANLPNLDIEHLYLFAYHSGTNAWELIPFQIDEVNPNVEDSLKYFESEDSLAGIFDDDDELVFMANDLGEKADSLTWASETDTIRYEICITDELNNTKGYVYLYYSSSLSDAVPNPYGMGYNAASDHVISENYEVGFNETGQLSDVFIKSESGTSQDLFDRVKIRAIGSLWILPIFLYEDYIEMGYAYAKVGPVRVIRNMFGYFNYEALEVNEAFTQTSFFYPWNGSFKLVEIPVEDAKQFGAEIDILRVSWDFSSNANGMNFYSEQNRTATQIDGNGVDDVLDTSCHSDQINWTMGTGDPGTILNAFYVPPLGDDIRIYYHESTDGSTGDNSELAIDTGDGFSYADNGFSLDNNIENYVTDSTTFNFIYYNYFLPPNFDPNDASHLCEQLKSPLSFETRLQTKYSPASLIAQTDFTIPDRFVLDQNYPNPFNSTTTISFSLPHRSRITLKIFDPLGRLVNTLVNSELPAGSFRYQWNGQNQFGSAAPTGVYFYQLIAGDFQATNKLILIK